MKIFRLSDPGHSEFARAARRGTWAKDLHGHSIRVMPLVIEWLPGAMTVGDFTWPGFDSDVVVRTEVGEMLAARFSGFVLGEIRILQPASKKRRSLPSILSGQLRELHVTHWANADMTRSTIERVGDSSGTSQLVVTGVARMMPAGAGAAIGPRFKQVARVKGQGIFIPTSELGQNAFFRVVQFPAWVFCTEGAVEFLTSVGFTNVGFLEMGEDFLTTDF